MAPVFRKSTDGERQMRPSLAIVLAIALVVNCVSPSVKAKPQGCVLNEDNAPKGILRELCGSVVEHNTAEIFGGEGLPRILMGKAVGVVTCSYVGGKLEALFAPTQEHSDLCDFSVLDRIHFSPVSCRPKLPVTEPQTPLDKKIAETVSLVPECKP